VIAFKSPSGHRCERQEHEFPQERMTLFDTLRHDGKAEELFNEFPKQQNGSSFLIRAASLHALAQFDQRLVEALDAEQAQPRILDFDSHSRAHLAWEFVVFARVLVRITAGKVSSIQRGAKRCFIPRCRDGEIKCRASVGVVLRPKAAPMRFDN